LIGASLAGYQIGLNIGEKYVPASLASFIVGTQPVIVMIMAFFFLKEKITLYTLIGLSISVAGIFIIFYSNSEDAVNFNVSTLIILAATLSNALYLILQKPLLKKYTAIQILPWYVWFTTFVLLPYFPGLIHDVNNAAFHDSMGVVYLGIFPTLIAFALWTYAISIIPLSKAASGFYLIPLFTMIIGYLFLHETLGVCTLLGGLVTVAGALIINRR
jgi:drug/metabolite transporter (DMT)-like permease